MNTGELFSPAGIDTATFIRDYWQQRPLLVRGAMAAAELADPPAEELAGMACEPEVESRLILRHADDDWEVRHGPFDEADFASLPADDWTLLVQDVDKFLPQVAGILDRFRFLPDWRIDDIMISYAEDKGGVGPHTDAYDVFLLQAGGRRRWRLGGDGYTDEDLVPGQDIRVLSYFDTTEDWILEPGDLLYLPPHLAHWGTAVGACMTWSVGFRSPDQHEIVSHWFDHLARDVPCDPLPDAGLDDSGTASRLDPPRLAAARSLVTELQGDPGFDHWYAGFITEPKPGFAAGPLDEPLDSASLLAWLRDGAALCRHPASRMAWRESGNTLRVYCQGQSFDFDRDDAPLVTYLCTHGCFDPAAFGEALTPSGLQGMVALVNAGCWELPQEDEA